MMPMIPIAADLGYVPPTIHGGSVWHGKAGRAWQGGARHG